MTPLVEVSAVTPVYCGEAYLPRLVDALAAVRERWDRESAPMRLAEVIFVIDAAIDGSENVLRSLAVDRPWVRVITLARNFGQHPATMAGIAYTSGDWVVTLDEDMQHDPRHIDAMLCHAVTHGLDVVYARPRAAVHESVIRDLGSRLYKRLMVGLTGNRFIALFNSYRLMRGAVARAVASVSSHDTYYDIGVGWFTNRIAALTFDLKDERFIGSGQSGYTLRRLISHARRMLVTSETKLLRIGALAGIIAIAGCVVLATRALISKLLHPESVQVQGWTSLFIGISLLGGLTLLLLSIIIEFLTIVLLHSQGKPTFFVIDRSSDEALVRFFAEPSRHAPA